MAVNVNKLNYDLHTQAGLDAYADWLTTYIVSPATIIDIWYGEGMSVEIVVWDDGA